MSYIPTALELAVYQWLEPYITGTLIYENQDAPRPATTFSTLLVIDDARVGRPATQVTDTPTGDDFVGYGSTLRSATVRVTSYGRTAYAVLQGLQEQWSLPDSSYQAGLLGLSIYNITQARRIPQILSQVTEDRWIIELQVYAVREVAAATQALNSIDATVSLTDPS